MPEKLKFHLSVQPEIQTAASYRKIHIFQTVKAMRLKFYEHAWYSFHSPVLTIKRFKLPITYCCTQIAAFS
jgi:hypothetical protein